jgi:tetratricopeptide (TPR) repeat protein
MAFVSLLTMLILTGPMVQEDADARAVFEQANTNFLAGRFEEAAAGFDEVVRLVPGEEPYLWQRGITLYYVERYQDCREQFELHRTVNPGDVENAVWHFMCVAKLESAGEARRGLLPVGRDPRSPMPAIYEMFQGTMTPEQVLDSATSANSSQFFAHLYLGLYFDAIGDQTRGLEHIRTAAEDRFGQGTMQTVARLHLGYMEGRE